MIRAFYGRESVIKSCLEPSFLIRRRMFADSPTGAAGTLLSYDRDTGAISVTQDSTDTTSSSSSSSSAALDRPMFHTVIGIEIHAQLSVPTKLFSSSVTKHGRKSSQYTTTTENPNTTVSLHDIGYPGTLPLLSRKSVQFAVLSAAALQCQIQQTSRFERKHYFYADLPLGYQVTQQRWPLAKDGLLTCRRYTPPEAKAKKKRKSNNSQQSTSGTNKSSDGFHHGKKDLPKFFSVGIDRIQIEQDTGKTTTVTEGSTTTSLIDFNRAGCTLIEVVFRPQIKSAHEAASVASTVQALLKHIKTCDGKMEDGSLRVDLNISIAPLYDEKDEQRSDDHDKIVLNNDNPFEKYLPPGTGQRVEVKNLNSLKQIIQSVEYEGLRQARIRLGGDVINQETRTFNPKSGKTVKIRDKGGAVDYRFMPEPDLPPLVLNNSDAFDGKDLQTFLADALPELPEEATIRLMDNYGITEDLALIITSDRPAISIYEDAVKICIASMKDETNMNKISKVPTTVANWLCNDLFALVKESATTKEGHTAQEERSDNEESFFVHPISMEYSKVDAERLGLLIALIVDEVVSTTQGKKLLEVMYKEDLSSSPKEIADARGWKLITDSTALKELCHSLILDTKNQKQLEQYKQGGKHIRKMKKFFVGKIMAASKGNAHPELLQDALDEALDEIAPGVE